MTVFKTWSNPIKEEFVTDQEKMLFNAPIPSRTRTYTPISHEDMISRAKEYLEYSGYEITAIDYMFSNDLQVMTGKYELNFGSSEIKMQLALQNSYNKKISAKNIFGGKVAICSNGMYRGEFPFVGKHTGDIDIRFFESLQETIDNSKNKFEELLSYADALKGVTLSKRATDSLFGQLFRDKKLFTDSQFLNFRQEYFKKVPKYDYGVKGKNNMWNLYNLATSAIEMRSNSSNYIQTHLNISNLFNDILEQMGV